MEFTKEEKAVFSKMGNQSAKKRHAGKSKEEISQFYRELVGKRQNKAKIGA